VARLTQHAELRRQVEAATRLGISLRRWSGWEPVRTVTTMPDGTQQITTEPEWDDDDRAWVEALLDLEAQRCPGCGGHLPETTDPANDGAYVTGPPHRCHRCTALHARQAQYDRDPNRAAQVVWPIHLRR
jgi:hypothetical protein